MVVFSVIYIYIYVTVAQHVNFVCPGETRFGDPKSRLQEVPEINSGCEVKEYSNGKHTADPGNSANFIVRNPEEGFWDDFLWRMRIPKLICWAQWIQNQG